MARETASAIVLAGGRSSRMGQPKPALRFGDLTILERLVAELHLEFDEIIVVAAPAAMETFAADDLLRDWLPRVCLLRDETAFQGPAPALIRGLRAARHPIAFVCSCDSPLIRRSLARALCDMAGDFDAVIPEIAGKSQPLCAVYKSAAAEKIEATAREDQRRLTIITNRLSARRPSETELHRVDPDLRSFLNVNTPEDFARTLKIAGFAP